MYQAHIETAAVAGMLNVGMLKYCDDADAKLAALLVIAMRAEAAGEKGSCAGAQTSQSCARAGGARRSMAAAAAARR